MRTHTDMLLSPKKHELSPFLTTWMDLEGIMLNEISEKDKHSDFTLRWNIRETNKKHTYIKMNKLNKNQHIDTEKRVVTTRGEAVRQREKWIKGVSCMETKSSVVNTLGLPGGTSGKESACQ